MYVSRWLSTLVLAVAAHSGMVRVATAADAPFNILKVRVKQAKAVPNGSVTAKGDFATSPPEDTFDAGAPIGVRFTDAGTLDQSYSWGTTECVVKPRGTIICASPDKRFRAQFAATGSAPSVFRYKIRFAKLDTHAPFLAPVRVTVTHGTTPTERTDAISECKTASSGNVLTCNHL